VFSPGHATPVRIAAAFRPDGRRRSDPAIRILAEVGNAGIESRLRRIVATLPGNDGGVRIGIPMLEVPMHRPRSSLRGARALTVAAAVLAAGPALAQASAAGTGVASAPDERVGFASWTPKTVGELVAGNRAGATLDLTGTLFLPPGTGTVPAVVLMHGSGGLYDALLDYWPGRFNAAGIAVLTFDRFGPRGVRNTTDDQSRVPPAADIADAFAALRFLATQPRIDAQRVALMGFSRGGSATLRAAVERFIAAQKLPDGLRYAAFIPTYTGGCVGTFRLRARPGVFGKAPMLFIHGTADDYTPIEPCREYAGQIRDAGTPVDFVALDGAQHKFDAGDPRRHHVRRAQRTPAECPIEVDVDTFHAYDRTTGARLAGSAYRDAVQACRATGASVQGNAQARDQAARAAVSFLERTFAR
jgi:dienelactone hydrolase